MEPLKNIVVQIDEATETRVIGVKNITEPITDLNMPQLETLILSYSELSDSEKKVLNDFVTMVKSKI